jgi:geranylgeranyl diphosphate synthase type I
MTNTDNRFDKLLNELATRRQQVYDYIFASDYVRRLSPQHIHDAALSYLRLRGKSLRPSVLLLSCGAVGGNETHAIPAAAGIEIYHTWTLVHDDVIDRDERRRGGPTVHVEFAERGARELGFSGADAEHYGEVIAILTGDVQQSWAYMLFHELHTRYGADPALVLKLVGELATEVQLKLVEGETLDVQFTQREARALSEAQVVEMLREKTGVLYEYAGRAGAMIGLNDITGEAPQVGGIAYFCGRCGTAFQLQDDILGVVGDAARTGKPVGADLREGKKTLIVFQALRNANDAQRRHMLSIIGNPAASDDQIAQVTQLLKDLDGIAYTQRLAVEMMHEALTHLDVVPPSPYKDLLQTWAAYMIERQF